MKIIFCLLFCLQITFSLIAQNLEKLSIQELDSINLHLSNEWKFEECLPYAQQLLKKVKETGNDSLYGAAMHNLFITLYYTGAYEKSEPIGLEALQIQAKAKNVGKNHPDYANTLATLASLYQALAKYEQAEAAFLEAKTIFLNTVGRENENYLMLVNDLGLMYKNMGDYDQAEPLYLETKTMWAKTLGKEHRNYATSLNNLAMLYIAKGEYQRAEPLLLESLQIRLKTIGKEHPNYALGLNNLAAFYIKIKNYKEAENYYNQAKKLRLQLLGKESIEYAASLNNIAEVYKITKRYDEAEKFWLESNTIRLKLLGARHPESATTFLNLAGLYLKTNKLDSAFRNNITSLIANSTNMPDTFSNLANLSQYDFIRKDVLINSLANLLDILQAQYEQTKDIHTLEQHFVAAKAAMQLLERVRNDFTSEGNKFRILSKNNLFVNHGTRSALLLGTQDKQEEAFNFAEQNKSVLLANTLQAQRARALSNLPDSMIIQELDLQKKLDELKKKQIEAKDSTSKSKLNVELNDLNVEVNKFKKTIEKDYPNYHKLKYINNIASVQDIQKILDKNTLLLEYYVADTSCYIFAVTQNKLKSYVVSLPQDSLKNKVEILRNSLSNYDFIKEQPTLAYNDYTSTAYYFYTTFIEPALKEQKDIHHLIIVPDNLLGHLPFEAFLSKPASSKEINYSDLNYLIKDFKISYTYSATLLKENYQPNNKPSNGQLLAIAANYKTPSTNALQNRNAKSKLLRLGLQELPSAKLEVEKIHKLLGGKILLDSTANEKNFKQLASNYSIIHLAMHGLLDAKNPILSSLAFTENGDSIEDNFLQAYEISKLELNTDLIVLSACETGYGKFQQGEGVMSLGRAFMYAGVPSLVMSLWAVNDQSTATLMEFFYKELANGKDKAEALRQAKILYLKNAKNIAAHPAFWAPFVQVGNNSPILIGEKNTWFWWVLGLGIGVVFIIGVFVLRKKRQA